MMRAVMLVNTSDLAWSLMPEVLARVARFCVRYDSVADPEFLCQQVRNHFAVGSPGVVAVALVAEDGVVGHVLAEKSDWAGSCFATILQYELDRAMSEADRLAGFEVIERWARDIGALGIQIFARTRGLARAFRRYGLTESAVLMRKPIKDPIAIAPEGDARQLRPVPRLTMPLGV